MKEQRLKKIINGLQTILTEGGKGNFVIFDLPDRDNQYIQAAGGKGSHKLWVEAGLLDQLSKEKMEGLARLGWNPPGKGGSMNHFQSVSIADLKDFEAIADMIMKTFSEIYEMKENEEIETKINLE